MTGCHLIYNACFAEKDPNFDAPENNDYQYALKQYLKDTPIYVLLDNYTTLKIRCQGSLGKLIVCS